jgi:CBS domain containing-hemolysin-like protein
MLWLLLSIAVTLSVSFVSSLFEAVIMSSSTAEIEALKKARPRRGRLFETMRVEIEETMSAVLSLNTLSNGIGSMIVGVQAARIFGGSALDFAVASFAVILFVGSEILPKNVGVVYRRRLQPVIAYPLWWLRRVLRPITWVCNLFIRLIVRTPPPSSGSEEEIILLAERGAQDGTLSKSESSIIANALSLDDVRVGALMTPRTVVTALRRDATVAEIFSEYPTLPFGRLPVYSKTLDDIVGLARRRDLLKAKANDQDQTLVEQIMHEQLLVVVDEFGATAGVVTMEDVIEHLLGREIFEKDDVAVDMRELARARQAKQSRTRPRPAPNP